MQVQVSLTIEIEATAGITEMEEQIQEAGQRAMRQAMKQAIRQWEKQHRACQHRGEKQRRLEGTTRRVTATCFGRVEVLRRRFRCLGCGRRCCPANRLLASLQGGPISAALQEAARLSGCSWPYRVAAHLLNKLSGAQISVEEIRLLTNRGGKQRATQQQEEAEQACACSPSSPSSLQSANQPRTTRRDGKVAVICSHMEDLPMPTYSTTFSWSERGVPRRPPRQRQRLAQRRYVVTFGPSRQSGHQAKAAVQTLDADPARSVVVIADGAEWIKKEQERHFAQATCILDWAHLWREVSHAITAAARAKALSEQERDFQLYWHRTSLWLGGVDQALQGLRHLAIDVPTEPLNLIQEAIRYLENQRPWIGSYERWKGQGYPVGSGMIERAVVLVINRRMKKRGIRRSRPNATAVVALRADLLNDDWMIPHHVRAFP